MTMPPTLPESPAGGPQFQTRLELVQVGALTLRLWVVANMDEAIDYYAETAPDDTTQIPYYTRLWESASALAEAMAARPAWWPGRRVLELGCGLGLPALVAARLGAAVTATDFHPHNGPFFLANARENGLERVRYERLDWRRPHLAGYFDVVLGSDLIYEAEMVTPFVHCATRYCIPGGLLLLADPGRQNLQRACTALEQAGFTSSLEARGEIYVFTFTRRGGTLAAADSIL
jgi:predicted nicotinamide N-methyase